MIAAAVTMRTRTRIPAAVRVRWSDAVAVGDWLNVFMLRVYQPCLNKEP